MNNTAHTLMNPYRELVKEILENGIEEYNQRTKSVCKLIVGTQLKFDLRKGFPALSSRQLPFKNIRGELLGFFRGYTSASDFRTLGCNFWDKNANETESWLDNPFRKGIDDLGPVYGSQWKEWNAFQTSKTKEQDDYLQSKGWDVISARSGMYDDEIAIWYTQINQLENVIHKILTDPSDRRIIVSGWNPADIVRQCLPACHMDYRFVPVTSNNTLHVVMTMRSMDVFLGTPANIASTAMFLKIVARLTGYTAGEVVIQGTNAHLYSNSYEAAKQLIEREEICTPDLILSDNIKPIGELTEITGCFDRIQPDDVQLENYCHAGKLYVEMIA